MGRALLLLWLACLVCGAGCGAAPRPAAPPAAPRSTVSAAREAPPPPVHARDFAIGSLRLQLRAGELSHLIYTLDCASRQIRCSHDAYRQLLEHDLGGWDDDDRTALQRWSAWRSAYSGRIERRAPSEVAPPLPMPGRQAQLQYRLRQAMHRADSIADFEQALAFWIDPADVQQATQVLSHFAPRFARHWARIEPSLRARLDALVALLQTPRATALLEQMSRFFEHPPQHTFPFRVELVAHPQRDASTRGELLGESAVFELDEAALPPRPLDLIVHELAHALFAAVPAERLLPLWQDFTRGVDPFATAARPALVALNEALATSWGNGLLVRELSPSAPAPFAEDPRALYGDEVVSRLARAALTPLDAARQRALTVTDPAFAELWRAVARDAFPQGAPATACLRPLLLAHSPAHEPSIGAFLNAVGASHSVTQGSLDPHEEAALFDARAQWPLVLTLHPRDVPKLRGWRARLGDEMLTQVSATARRATRFGVLGTRPGGALAVVLVAETPEALQQLFSQLLAQRTLRPGLLRP